jgi:ribonuclease T1
MSQRNRRGPATNQRPTVSVALLVVAVVIFFILQWNNGRLSGFFGVPAGNGANPTPTAEVAPVAQEQQAAPTDTPLPAPTQTATAAAQATRASPTATAQPSPTSAETDTVEQFSDLPTIAYEELPPEAQETIALIDQGGPFPFDRDGIVFQNREGILPSQARGYYHEYTVITPGSDDRGARRIVTGEEGDLYYTDDHYESFQEVIR